MNGFGLNEEEHLPTDQEIIDKLTNQGYQVEMLNPDGETFYERYVVYKNMPPLGNRIVIIDANGNIVGAQG